MNNNDFQDIWDKIKKNVQTQKIKLEKNMPEIEQGIVKYARKIGISPEDIEKVKDRVREKN